MARALTGTYRVIGHTVLLGVSVGVAVRENGEELDELMRRADAAMYTAKATGEGGRRLFDPDVDLVQRRGGHVAWSSSPSSRASNSIRSAATHFRLRPESRGIGPS